MQNKKSENRQLIPIYTLLFGIFPVLSLAATNLSQIDLSSTYRSLFLSIGLALLLFGLIRIFQHNTLRAAFLAFLLLVLFYSYGHVFNLLGGSQRFGAGIKGHLPLLTLWACLVGLSTWLSLLRTINLRSLTPVLNIFTAILLVYPLFQIGAFKINHLHRTHPTTTNAPASASAPDIYYIILDAYERADTMKIVYDYDNSAFIAALEQRGFYVAGCSQSNYAYTQPSLASSLNLDYLDHLGVSSNTQADPLLQENAVRRFLKDRGYTIVAFESGFSWSQWEDADVYYRYRADAGYLNGFEALFLRTTLLRARLDAVQSEQDATYGILQHNRILYNLETLKNVPAEVKSPKFVFVHLTIPHPPFLFSPTGALVTTGAENATSVNGYRNSVTFINQAILQVVDHLQQSSATPPVIVLQGDHGAPLYHDPHQRMTILNAYYLPDMKVDLYPTISPVNTFRLILNAYFGQHYPLLPDVSQYSPTRAIYDFSPIPTVCGK